MSGMTTAYPGTASRCSSPVKAPPGSRCCMAAHSPPPVSSAGRPVVSSSVPRIVRNTRMFLSPFPGRTAPTIQTQITPKWSNEDARPRMEEKLEDQEILAVMVRVS
ncbi:hypothetical protein J3R03_007438 [Actinoplanes couchii]|nr:hypothetical protein [Actinoplanes couchii]